VDRRYLSAVLSGPRRCLAGRRSRGTGGGKNRAWAQDAAERETDGAAGGAVAADAWRRRASVVVLLQGAQETRRRDRRTSAASVTTFGWPYPLSAPSQTV